jgi:hypothetical protein
MLGDILSEREGKRVARRVVSAEPLTVEVSGEDTGKVLGVDTTGFWSYQAVARADGSLFGEGKGAIATADGELISFIGSGVGKLKERGAVSYRGVVYFRTMFQKLARLNNTSGVFEFEIDAEGEVHWTIWEWK